MKDRGLLAVKNCNSINFKEQLFGFCHVRLT